jgi:nucleoside-diphosphate-sugar epimerase
VKAGYRVRGFARSTDGLEPLRDAGVEIVRGDITQRDTLTAAMQGINYVVHAAALIGGTWATATEAEYWAVNYHGGINVMNAAEAAGVRRVVDIDSLAILDWWATVTERSPVLPVADDASNYTKTKRASYYETMHRAALGQDIVFVTPGGIYGPGPLVERAMHPTSFSAMIALALNGGLERYVSAPLLWVYVDDVVVTCLAALERGRIGDRYLACGREGEECGAPALCNRAAELAGLPVRVQETDIRQNAAEAGRMAKTLSRNFASPALDASATRAALGVQSTSLDEGLRKTVAWLRANKRIPAV